MSSMGDEKVKNVEAVGMAEKKRDERDKFTVVLPPEVREAFEELAAAGFVVSRLVVELLEESVPVFKAMSRAALAAKRKHQLSFDEVVGSMLKDMGEHMVTKVKRGRPRKVKP